MKNKTPLLVSFLLVVTACTINIPAPISKTDDTQNEEEVVTYVQPVATSTPIITSTPSVVSETKPSTAYTSDVNNANLIKPISIEYSPKYFNLTVGQLSIVKASVNLSNGTKESDFQIKSENSGILNIENSGVIRAVSAGNTTISIISNRDKSVFVSIPIVVTLEKVLVNSVSINPPSISFKVGDSLSLGATVNLSDGTKNSKVSWLSFNENILKVDSTGKITAIASGETKVEATSIDDNGKRTTANVIISNVDVPLPPPKVVVDTITLSDQSLTLNIGQSQKLTASVKLSDGNTNSLVNWSSSDNSIVSINPYGLVSAQNQGQAIITASSKSEPDKKVSIPITINKIPVIVSSLVINVPYISNLKVGDSINLSATVTKSDGTSNNNVIWRSLNTSLADITSTGVFTAKSDGMATIEASAVDDVNKKKILAFMINKVIISTPTPIATPVPTPTPNIKKVAFTSYDRVGTVYMIDIDGTNQTKLADNSYNPSWNPKVSNKIIFTSTSTDGNGGKIYSMNTDNFNKIKLTNDISDDSEAVWSPDGTKIAFSSTRSGSNGYKIYIMNADGSNQVKVTNNLGSDFTPSWSPDGTKISFSNYNDNNFEIYVINIDGTNQIRLTDNPAVERYSSWLPDGTKIAFSSTRDGVSGIYIMNTDGTNQVRLTSNGSEPVCSPDGTKIAFVSGRDGNAEIYTMNIDGTNQVRLTNNTFYDYSPSWSK